MQSRFLILMVGMTTLMLMPDIAAQSEADSAGWAQLAELGEGFVVWETNRDDKLWRIWRRNLDGTEKRRLSPEEADRDHICPAISPDGEWIAYMSQPRGIGYSETKPEVESPLRIMRADGTADRELVDNARRISTANRAVVWMDREQLLYLDGDHLPRRLNVRTGEVSEPLHKERGFVPNAAMTYVFDRYHVHPFDAAAGKVEKRGRRLDGCEPLFTSDSRWSVRMTGAGGPIARIDPATGAIHPLLAKGDSRLPGDRGYLYFPMVSPCRRLLVFAASPNQHDHFSSDYDLFVIRVDPESLEPSGQAVRYTFHPGTDRYPDVFLADLPLGRHVSKAPLTVALSAPDGAVAQWESGDGGTGNGGAFAHTFTEPGRYTMLARVDGREYRGHVHILPATPPAVSHVALVDARTVQVLFNEPVDITQLRVGLASRLGIEATTLSDDGRRLSLRLAGDAHESDQLTLERVRDRAQRPNEMPATSLRVERGRWPVSEEGLLFAYHAGTEPPRFRAEREGDFEMVSLRPQGLARYDRHYAIEMGHGAAAVPSVGPRLSKALRAANALSIEVVFRSAELQQSGPARIVTLSRDTSSRNFTMGQQRDRLVLRLRTPRTGANGLNPEVDLGPIVVGETHHVIVTYRAPDEVVVFRDGKEVVRRHDSVRGDFSNWEEMELMLGDELSGGRDWRGRVEAVALYDRPLTSEEASRAASVWRGLLAARGKATSMRVETEVVALSPLPSMGQIAPYREGLLLAEHVIRKSDGANAPPVGAKVRIAHWALLDGQPVPATSGLRMGSKTTLEVEPFAEQPQIQALFLSDELDIDLEQPLFLNVTPL